MAASNITYSVMWRGICHSVPAEDVRRLLKAGMVRRAPGNGEVYEGVLAQTVDHRSPADAVRWLVQRSGGTGAAYASTTRPANFWQPPGGQRPGGGEQTGHRRRSISL